MSDKDPFLSFEHLLGQRQTDTTQCKCERLSVYSQRFSNIYIQNIIIYRYIYIGVCCTLVSGEIATEIAVHSLETNSTLARLVNQSVIILSVLARVTVPVPGAEEDSSS